MAKAIKETPILTGKDARAFRRQHDSVIDRLITKDAKCVKCNAPMGGCDCWTKCKCGWLFEKGGKCSNHIHK